jgi:3-deoxy-D-manno-octulosonate 8-phosphate phosphatase KdsC-like HAD superfamily phosphatase
MAKSGETLKRFNTLDGHGLKCCKRLASRPP